MAFRSLLLTLAAALPISDAGAACATAWVQCGGTGWAGPTCCPSGFSCSQMNSWYSQCVPKGSIAPPEQPKPVAEDECYHMFSELSFNTLVQSFPSNPDSEATAYVDCKLCSHSGMHCTANVLGGRTQLIASHIHLASDGDGVNGSGPPVINFCGENGPGFIADGSKYKTPCAHYANRAALMSDMQGNFVDGEQNAAFTLGSRLKDIASNPSKYYFNFHSIASWTHWQIEGKGPVGMCRGVMQLSQRRLTESSDKVDDVKGISPGDVLV
ncbi:cel6A [Symbiodinium natans]|uniref:Cel6A protein n=1 Tax=Symbiodinium natans TaxID=878477 RepID=A0A812QF26_9DINO|nr:cel6A [Symbiodinium natans]CAE7387323.1 cel6A [Symbiodinium natans]CAE7387403.1 cel6A [Symbiodinium natans]